MGMEFYFDKGSFVPFFSPSVFFRSFFFPFLISFPSFFLPFVPFFLLFLWRYIDWTCNATTINELLMS